MTTGLRVAFTGASGTGKSTLADHVAEKYGLAKNPVGSRSVSAAMGFASPYDVDAAGKRAEFQHRLLRAKTEWEFSHRAFVTDRTTADNLAYLSLHAITAVDADVLDMTEAGLARYTHVFLCPVSAFFNVGDDPARVKDPSYHRVYDALLAGLLVRLGRQRVFTLQGADLEGRIEQIDLVLAAARPRTSP